MVLLMGTQIPLETMGMECQSSAPTSHGVRRAVPWETQLFADLGDGAVVFFFPKQRTVRWHDWSSVPCRPLQPRCPGSDIFFLGSFSLCFLCGSSMGLGLKSPFHMWRWEGGLYVDAHVFSAAHHRAEQVLPGSGLCHAFSAWSYHM